MKNKMNMRGKKAKFYFLNWGCFTFIHMKKELKKILNFRE